MRKQIPEIEVDGSGTRNFIPRRKTVGSKEKKSLALNLFGCNYVCSMVAKI